MTSGRESKIYFFSHKSVKLKKTENNKRGMYKGRALNLTLTRGGGQDFDFFKGH